MNSKVTRIFADDREDWTTIRRDLWYLQYSPFLSERVEYIKVGLLPILKHGLPLISRIKRKSGLKVICDLKLSEVPFLSGQIAQLVKSSGADGIVVQAFAGIQVIDAVRDAAPELNIFLVTEMSHNGGGFTAVHLLEFAELAKDAKVFAVIGPGNRPERLKMLRDHVGRDVQVAAAGVSHHQGGSEAQAASMGANLVIDGRSLLDRIKEKRSEFWAVILRHVKIVSSVAASIAGGLWIFGYLGFLDVSKWFFLSVFITWGFACVSAYINASRRQQ